MKIFNLLKRFKKSRNHNINLTKSSVLNNACKFVVNECIEGDYYEFGIWRGQTIISAFLEIKNIVSKRIRNSKILGENKLADMKRKNILEKTNFHAFDSFEGLPSLEEEDKYSDDFKQGQFKCEEKDFIRLIKSYGLSENKFIIHKGWFNKTCNYEYFKKNNLKKASIIWIDCDLYSSARDCLEIVTFLLQDATIVVFDDWYCNKGSALHGVQKAFYEWIKSPEISKKWLFTEYQKDSWKRNSFIVNKLVD